MAPSENEGIHEGLETKFNQNWTERVCRVWVNLDVLGAGRPLPVYPDEQTFRLFVGMSQTCQTRTSSLYSITSSAARSSPGGTVTPSTFAVLRFAQRRPHPRRHRFRAVYRRPALSRQGGVAGRTFPAAGNDNGFQLGRYRKFGRLVTTQDAVDVRCRLPHLVDTIRRAGWVE
jgi:hypothetical protein